MGFFEDTIKKANDLVEWDKKSAYIVFPVQRAYIKVKSKYRGLEGKLYCVRFTDGYTWWTTRKSWRKAMDKLAYSGGDYLVLNDKRAGEIIIGDNEGALK